MLTITNLHATVEDKPVLKGINLTINPGEAHAIMGPNGSGKSTLSHVLAGRPGYEVTDGEVLFHGKDLSELEVDERAQLGIFLSFQYPVEIPGVTSMNFLKSSVNALRKAREEEELDAVRFLKLVREKAKAIGVKESLLKRALNCGFSGGEKKRFEMLQMALLEPSFAILDETDSGLDIDALKSVAQAVNAMRDGTRSFLIITHYQRLLDHITPDHVHILADGKLVTSGGIEIAQKLEKEGYAGFNIEDREAPAA